MVLKRCTRRALTRREGIWPHRLSVVGGHILHSVNTKRVGVRVFDVSVVCENELKAAPFSDDKKRSIDCLCITTVEKSAQVRPFQWFYVVNRYRNFEVKSQNHIYTNTLSQVSYMNISIKSIMLMFIFCYIYVNSSETTSFVFHTRVGSNVVELVPYSTT